jgi:glycosyltransferase involved in cell wall biosynthesis
MTMLSVIVPTYNEAQNIERIVERLEQALTGMAHELIVVDDSVDGTDTIAAELALTHPSLRVFHREGRRGLASAVIDGIRAARGDILCVLDADFQHPPETLPTLVRALEHTGTDLAIASRYVPGGGYQALSPWRRVVSWVATGAARLLLRRARGIADPVSGFFAFRRGVVEGVALQPVGYKILLEVLVRGHLSQVVEVPYRFEARHAGRSKLTLSLHVEYLRHLLRLATVHPGPTPRRVVYTGDLRHNGNGDVSRAAAEKRREFVRYPEDGPVPRVHITRGASTEEPPRVSVIIPAADGTRSHHVARLLQQLERQPFQQFEVIVVQGDRRQGRAINTAAAIARGQVLLTMDDDTQLGDPGVLEKLVQAFERDPTIGIAGVPNLIPPDAPPVIQRALREIPRRSSAPVESVTDSDMAEHPCLAIRKDVFYRVGGEHEQIPRGLDPYLRREVRRLGYRVVVIPDAYVHHLLPPHLGGILVQYFRNGLGAAYVKKFYPEFVIEQAEAHGEVPREQTSLVRRAVRYAGRAGSACVSGKWIYLGTLASYAVGYAWGLATLRRDSL